MNRVLVFQHVPYEPLGTLYQLLRKAGYRIRYVNFGRDPDTQVNIESYDALVILGGPMGVYEAEQFPHLNKEMGYIRAAAAAEKPILGICLGSQLIAAAFGAPVSAMAPSNREIGWFDVTLTDAGLQDPVLGGMNRTEKIFQWHGDTFEVPPGGVLLAHSEACPFQAFRLGDRIYGFQFHLEVDQKVIDRWLQVPENASVFEGADGERLRARIMADTKMNLEHSLELSRRVFIRYINICNARSKLRWQVR